MADSVSYGAATTPAARLMRVLPRIVDVALALACVVVVLGAYTRLVDAGLGCPDWPGCYGYLSVPDAHDELAAARARFPHAPVEAEKAWAEMVHRYFAGTLGVLVLGIAVLSFVARHEGAPFAMAGALVVLVALQAAFGAWTVTLKLWPQVVTAHLLGGFATLAMLWVLRERLRPSPGLPSRLRGHAAVAAGVLVLQIALGGWTSSNYAALACPDFPTCQTQWWPPMDFARGFDVTQEVGPNYLGGTMHSSARAAIHVVHRIGALIVLVIVGALALRIWGDQTPMHAAARTRSRRLAVAVAAVLLLQIGLGISNVVFTLPVGVATAHNAVAAGLLLVLVSVNYRAFSRGLVR